MHIVKNTRALLLTFGTQFVPNYANNGLEFIYFWYFLGTFPATAYSEASWVDESEPDVETRHDPESQFALEVTRIKFCAQTVLSELAVDVN